MRSAINTLRKRDVQPIHKFHTVRLPRLNKNLHLRDDQLQVQIDWIVTDCESPGKVSDVTTFVRVELHFPSGEEAQHLETEEFGVFDNVSRGHADMLFQVNTAHWFHTRFVVLKVQGFKRLMHGDTTTEILICRKRISLRGLETLATISYMREMPQNQGVLEVNISQCRPFN
ncbi:unnamed protein product, partial [Dicrocoelium dendriticum]